MFWAVGAVPTGYWNYQLYAKVVPTAFYKRSFASLEKARGNLAEAQQWTVEALDGFDRLGMQPEMDEMQRLLEESNEEAT